MSALVLTMLLAASPVSDVVVYPDRAQVVRTTAVACGPNSTARFDGLTPAAERGSFQATVTGGTLLGLSLPDNDFTRGLAPRERKSALHALLLDCLASAAREVVEIVGEQHLADAEVVVEADHINIAIERAHALEIEGQGDKYRPDNGHYHD